MKIERKGIEEKREFNRKGIHYNQVLADDENHTYLYKMEQPGVRYLQYEVVKGKKTKDDNGNVVYVLPSDEDFGRYGWYFCGTREMVERKICEKWHSLTNRMPKIRV